MPNISHYRYLSIFRYSIFTKRNEIKKSITASQKFPMLNVVGGPKRTMEVSELWEETTETVILV